MAQISPQRQLGSFLANLVNSPQFQQLSPASQQAIQQYAQAYAKNPSMGVPNDAAFGQAMGEAKQKGLVPEFTWKTLVQEATILGGALVGGMALSGALSGGGAASTLNLGPVAAGGGTTEATIPASLAAEGAGGAAGGSTLALGPVAAGGGTTAATVPSALSNAGIVSTAAAKTPSLLHDLLPTIIGAGSAVGGAAIAAHANTEAAKIAAEQADKALQIQKEQYALQREDTAPYRALGQGAVGNLGYLSGIDVAGTAPALASTVPKQPYGTMAPTQAPTLESGGTNTGIATGQHSVLVPVKNPATGLIHLVPNNEVSAAIQAGGQVTR